MSSSDRTLVKPPPQAVLTNATKILAALNTSVNDQALNEQISRYVLQLSVSVFCLDTLSQPNTTEQIIERAQNEYLALVRNGIDHLTGQGAFDRFVSENGDPREIHGNDRLIETIRHINDWNEFFTSVANTNTTVRLTQEGLNLNEQIDIHPQAFSEIGGVLDRDRRTNLLDITAKYNDGKREDQYLKAIKPFRQEERFIFRLNREEDITRAASDFNVDDIRSKEIGGIKIFENMSTTQTDRLGRVLTAQRSSPRYGDMILAAVFIAGKRKCKRVEDFCSYFELIAIEIQGKKKAVKKEILDNLTKDSGFFRDFTTQLNADLEEAERLSLSAPFRFPNSLSAVYHFRKHGNEMGAKQNMRRYLIDVPSELFSNDDYKISARITQDGRLTRLVYANEDYKHIGFLIQKNDGSGQEMASIYPYPEYFGTPEQWEQRIKNAKLTLLYQKLQGSSNQIMEQSCSLSSGSPERCQRQSVLV
uniref:Uncharacterized protein n=1 Tax=Plectus sambesii TaxID=2011161 RepID=A0A914V2N3_9BILA